MNSFFFQGNIVNFTMAGQLPNYKRANNFILWLKYVVLEIYSLQLPSLEVLWQLMG